MRPKDKKIELFSYMMALGEDLARHHEFNDKKGFVKMCIEINNSRKELVKQYNNVKAGEGSVNGKWYSDTKIPFQTKIQKVRKNIRDRVKKYSSWFKVAFDSDGEIFLISNKIEVDISKF